MATQTMILTLEGLRKHFGGLKAVNGVNLSIQQGELRAVIGPNGAGKTTLFNLITGHLRPDAGKILFYREDLNGLPPHTICCKGMGRTFQITSVFLGLTVFENVQTAWLSRRGKTFNLLSPVKTMAGEMVIDILESVGLEKQAQKTASALSYGERRCLEVAIALAGDPHILLLDEPTAGMSLMEKRNMMTLIRKIASDKNLTVMFTEHDMDVVFGIAQRITVLHQGQVLAEGEPDQVKKNGEVRRVYLGQQGV